MKRILTIMAAIVCLASCEKPVDTSKIIGTWSECYAVTNIRKRHRAAMANPVGVTTKPHSSYLGCGLYIYHTTSIPPI